MPGKTTSCTNCPALYDTVRNVNLTGGKQIVPVWAPITPDALTHGSQAMAHSKGGYFTIMDAYGQNAACCDQKYATTGCRDPNPRNSSWGY
jgi:hypothetical protein